MRLLLTSLVAPLATLAIGSAALSQSFRNYETPQTRPIAVSSDGTRLFALNTPDNRLAVYSLANPSRPVLVREIVVGLEPVAIAQRTGDEVWVVNNLGDSISVVSLGRGIVIDTIPVKDEPFDIVFARGRAFVSVATDKQVRVFDGTSHRLVAAVDIFGQQPRSLAVDRDGSRVWVAIHQSGNGTTILPETEPTRPDPPKQAPHLPPPPKVGRIVRADDPKWRPRLGVDLADQDVFEISATTLKVTRAFRSVGTSLFNLAVDKSNQLWVANTQSRNLVPFEPQLNGHVIDSRVTRIQLGRTSNVTSIDLNVGIDYRKLPNDRALATALSQPTDLAFDPSGRELWVTAFGTDRVGVLDTTGKVIARVEVGDTPGTVTAPRRKRGPRGLAHHPSARRLYVLNRLSQSITVIDTAARRRMTEIGFVHDPTPTAIREGRGFLYDAKLSGNGTMACASCHVDANIDGLAWNLGDRAGKMFRVRTFDPPFRVDVHPMKGPMMTQTLKGLKGTEPFHWRGDRPTFAAFNGAFASLLGKKELSPADMAAYSKFANSIELGPNPNQLMDRTFSRIPAGESAADGDVFFRTTVAIGSFRCADCHALPTGSNGRIFTSGTLQTLQAMKVARLRTIYKRVGRRARSPKGQWLAGFGLLHDGSEDSVFQVLSRPVFGRLSKNGRNKRMLERFVMSFDTGTAPAVGFAMSVSKRNALSKAVADYLLLMLDQASRGNIDLIAHGRIQSQRVGLLYDTTTRRFVTSRQGLGPWTIGEILAKTLNRDAIVTFSGVPPGSGTRMALDRDLDGVRDGDEGLHTYGAASPTCARLKLTANSTPDLGNGEFALVTTGGLRSSTGLLVLGPTRTATDVLGIRLLVDLRGSLLLPYPTDRNGLGAVHQPLPNDARLKGVRFFVQAISASSCAPNGIEASNGLEVVLGR